MCICNLFSGYFRFKPSVKVAFNNLVDSKISREKSRLICVVVVVTPN